MSLILTILEFLWPTTETQPTEAGAEAYERLDEAMRRLRELIPEGTDDGSPEDSGRG